MRIEHTLEMRGMPRRELENYFLGLGGKQDDGGVYRGPNWEVILSDERPCVLGVISIPATHVTFRVEENDWPKIVSAFRLRFLSAGG